MADKNILLLEPSYKNKYPPLGLMKIAQYHGPRGKRDRVCFIKGEDTKALGTAWDRIYVTTLFTFEFARIAQSIDFALRLSNGDADKIFVGGIAVAFAAGFAVWVGLALVAVATEGPPEYLRPDRTQPARRVRAENARQGDIISAEPLHQYGMVWTICQSIHERFPPLT